MRRIVYPTPCHRAAQSPVGLARDGWFGSNVARVRQGTRPRAGGWWRHQIQSPPPTLLGTAPTSHNAAQSLDHWMVETIDKIASSQRNLEQIAQRLAVREFRFRHPWRCLEHIISAQCSIRNDP